MGVRVLPVLGLGMLAILAAGFVFATPILQTLGDFLVIHDPLGPADAVVAISGDGTGERAGTGAALVSEGYAPWLILSGSSTGHPQGGAAADMLRDALGTGLPRERIIVENQSESTFENARNTLRIMQARGLRRAIVVTSPYHTRRAARVFRAVYLPHGLEVRVSVARNSFFVMDRWWTRKRDRGIVVREYGKLLASLVGIR